MAEHLELRYQAIADRLNRWIDESFISGAEQQIIQSAITRDDDDDIVELPAIGGREFTPFPSSIGRRVVQDVANKLIRELRADGFTMTLPNQERLHERIANNLLTGNFDPAVDQRYTVLGLRGLPPIDQAMIRAVQEADLRLEAFPDMPTFNMQLQAILEAKRNEGKMTDEEFAILAGGEAPDDATFDRATQKLLEYAEAAADLLDIAASRQQGTARPDALTGVLQGVIRDEKARGVPIGESAFPLPLGETAESLRAQAEETRQLSAFGREQDIAKAIDANLTAAGVKILRNEYPDSDDWKAFQAARASLIGNTSRYQAGLLESNPSITQPDLRADVSGFVDNAIGRQGDSFNQVVATEKERILLGVAEEQEEEAAAKARTLTGSRAALGLYLSDKEVDPKDLRAHDRELLAKAIRENGGTEGIEDILDEAIADMQQLKVNEDILRNPEAAAKAAGISDDRVEGIAEQIKRLLAVTPNADVGAFLEGLRTVGDFPGTQGLDVGVATGFDALERPVTALARDARVPGTPFTGPTTEEQQDIALQESQEIFASQRPRTGQDVLDIFRKRQLSEETPLSREQAIEFGFSGDTGYTEADIETQFGSIQEGPLTPGQVSQLAQTGKFITVEDVERQFDESQVPDFPRGLGLISKTDLPDFSRIAVPPSRRIDFGFPETEEGKTAFSDRLKNMAVLAAEGDLDLQQFFADEIPKLLPVFQETGISDAKERERAARETATALQREGKFSPGQTASFIGDVGQRRKKLDFPLFAEERLPGLKQTFLESPFAIQREQRRVEAEARESEIAAERAEIEAERKTQRRLRRRGRTVLTRAF